MFNAQTNPTKRIHYVKEEIELNPLTSEQIKQLKKVFKNTCKGSDISMDTRESVSALDN